jgi:hypothetical protein
MDFKGYDVDLWSSCFHFVHLVLQTIVVIDTLTAIGSYREEENEYT